MVKGMWKADHVQARHEIILEQGLFDADALILDRSYITTTLCQSEWLIDVNCGILWDSLPQLPASSFGLRSHLSLSQDLQA